MALRNPFTRLVLTARRLIRDRKGAGAIEFAILFPVLIMLYIGAFEITIGLSVSKRVTRAAGTVADLITQQQSVTKSALAQMPSVATAIFVPYNSTALTMKITGVTIDASANAKVLWSWAQDGTAPYAKNTTVSNVPSDMKTANSFPGPHRAQHPLYDVPVCPELHAGRHAHDHHQPQLFLPPAPRRLDSLRRLLTAPSALVCCITP